MRRLRLADPWNQRLAICTALLVAGIGQARPSPAAAFDIDGPTIELRRVQFCIKCKKALVVTTVPPGTRIQCPNCDTVQHRLPSKYLLTRVYQVCPRCGARLDLHRFTPGDLVKCGNCGRLQKVLHDAVRQETKDSGTGRLPGIREVPPALLPPARAAVHPGGEQPRQENPAATAADDLGPELADEPPATLTLRPHDREDTPAAATNVAAPGILSGPPPDRESTTRVELDEQDGVRVLAPSPEDFGDAPDTKAEQGHTRPGPARHGFTQHGGGVLARVNGLPVLAGEVERMVRTQVRHLRRRLGRAGATPQGREFLADKISRLRRRAREQLIDRKLLEQEIEQAGISIPAERILARVRQTRRSGSVMPRQEEAIRQARYELGIEELLRRRLPQATEPSPAMLRAYYKRHRSGFMLPRRASLRSLVIFLDRAGRSDPRSAAVIAAEVRDRITAGDSFRDLVYRYSEGPNRERGGVLRMAGKLLVPALLLASPVREALEHANRDRILGPLRLSTCIAFVQVADLRQPAPRPLAEVADHIKARIRQQERGRALTRLLRDLRARARIEYPRNPGKGAAGPDGGLTLFSRREFKKASPRFFPEEE